MEEKWDEFQSVTNRHEAVENFTNPCYGNNKR